VGRVYEKKRLNERFGVEMETFKTGEILLHCFSEWSPDGASSL